TYATKKGGAEGLQEMQTRLSTTLQELDQLKTTHAESLKTELEKVNGQHTEKIIKMLTRVELSSLPEVELAVGANYISDPVLTALTSKYAVVLGDNDTLTLKQKANPALDVVDSKGKTVTFQQALREEVLAAKLGKEIKKNGGDGGGGRSKIIVGGDDGGTGTEVIPGYIANKINNNS